MEAVETAILAVGTDLVGMLPAIATGALAVGAIMLGAKRAWGFFKGLSK